VRPDSFSPDDAGADRGRPAHHERDEGECAAPLPFGRVLARRQPPRIEPRRETVGLVHVTREQECERLLPLPDFSVKKAHANSTGARDERGRSVRQW
jgi:hypothetical protein